MNVPGWQIRIADPHADDPNQHLIVSFGSLISSGSMLKSPDCSKTTAALMSIFFLLLNGQILSINKVQMRAFVVRHGFT
jgi:hypothetical protein